MLIIMIRKLCESFKQVKFFLNKSFIILVAMLGVNLVLCCMCWIVLFESSSKSCIDLNFRKPEFPVISLAPKNPFQNQSTFWGWALKQKCRACRVVQSLFLEFSKLFYKIWSNLKRRNSLNVPFLNLNLHFKM